MLGEVVEPKHFDKWFVYCRLIKNRAIFYLFCCRINLFREFLCQKKWDKKDTL